MDLLQTVRKEGSRGGVDFKWEDVKNSQHRQNYLGHSVMAPVGRWQKNRDLNWYAKAEDADKTPEEIAAAEKERRKEELRKVKEAEEDAMARALGLPVPDRSANTEPLGERKIGQKEIDAALKDALEDVDAPEKSGDRPYKAKEHRRRSRSRERHGDRHRRRSRSRRRSRDRHERRSNRDRYREQRRSRSPYQRKRSAERSPRRRSRDRSPPRRNLDSSRRRSTERSPPRRRDRSPRRERSPRCRSADRSHRPRSRERSPYSRDRPSRRYDDR